MTLRIAKLHLTAKFPRSETHISLTFDINKDTMTPINVCAKSHADDSTDKTKSPVWNNDEDPKVIEVTAKMCAWNPAIDKDPSSPPNSRESSPEEVEELGDLGFEGSVTGVDFGGVASGGMARRS